MFSSYFSPNEYRRKRKSLITAKISLFAVLKDAFDIFDTENKGAISYDVVGDILELFTGEEIDEDELDDLMDEYDEDESGEIEFSEFIELAEYFVEPEPDPKEIQKDLREVFVLYDKQKRGYIPTDDFKGILKALGPEVPEEELDGIVDEIDQDSSGTIDFDGETDFIKFRRKDIQSIFISEFIEILLGDDDNKKK